MVKLVNLARMTVSGTPGIGDITLGSAVAGYQSFADAGVADGDLVSYGIKDGDEYEFGRGTYTASGTSLERTTILGSSNSDAAVSLTSSAIVYVTALAEDLMIDGGSGYSLAGLIVTGTDGIDFNPGSDTDFDIMTFGVTGSPRIWWDESLNSIRFDGLSIQADADGFNVDAGGDNDADIFTVIRPSGSKKIYWDESLSGFHVHSSGLVIDEDLRVEGGSFKLAESAAADGDTSGYGQWWVRNDTPNTPMFTDDTGNDHVLQYAPSEGAFADGDKTKLDGIAAGAQVNRALASQAEAEAGINNTKGMTPLRTAQAIAAQAGGGGGMALLETIQPTSDVSAITFVTTDFSGYETAEIWFFGTGENTPSEYAVQGQFGDATWRDLATFNDATDLGFPSDGSMFMLSSVIRNVGNADSTGVVTARSAAGPDGQNVTWGRSSAGGEAAQDKIGHAIGFQARGSGLTGLRITASGGSFEGDDASTRCIAKLYAG